MPIPAPYQTFAKICIEQNVGYQQWQKTAETDKIINLLYDQIIGRNSAATSIARAQALINYLAVKSLMTNDLYPDAPAEVRLPTNELTYNNTLVSQNQGQFGLCGRFHRVLTTVMNEMTFNGLPATQAAITNQWLQNVIGGIYSGLNLILSPTVAPITVFQIESGDVEINTGATINVPAATEITLGTSAVGQTSQNWQLDTVNEGGQTDDVYVIAVPVTGTYRNSYTNTAGTTFSAEFDIVVAA